MRIDNDADLKQAIAAADEFKDKEVKAAYITHIDSFNAVSEKASGAN